MRLSLIVASLLLLTLTAACSGGSGGESGIDAEGPVLRLFGGDIPESGLRSLLRSLLSRPGASGTLCEGGADPSDDEIISRVFKPEGDGGLTPVQEADPDDLLRAVAIFREECERALESGATPTPAATQPEG